MARPTPATGGRGAFQLAHPAPSIVPVHPAAVLRSTDKKRDPYAMLLDVSKLRELRSASNEGQVVTLVWRSLRKRVSYESTALGLRCDLRADLPTPTAKVPLSVRPLRPDERELLRPEKGTDTPEDF